jgi:hypothetical protein
MTLVLHPEQFVNNKFTVQFGDSREALFTIVDEELAGGSCVARINRITILVYTRKADGTVPDGMLCTNVIGLGDGVAGVHTENAALRGKLLSRDNMEECVIELFEQE